MESKMTNNVSKTWSPKMPAGVDLEISQHPLTMKSVANLIIAMERLKGSHAESALSTEFRDENLLNIMLESLVEEQIVLERRAPPPDQFSRTGEQQWDVVDSQKRSMVLLRNSMELHAVMLQGGSESRKVRLNMSTYVHPAPTTEARAVALGIKDTNLYLSCCKDGDEPTLHLEEVEDKNSLTTIHAESDMARFLFYKRSTGLNISTLMSARFPDWYISTAEQDNRPVEMCTQSANRYQTFSFYRQN